MDTQASQQCDHVFPERLIAARKLMDLSRTEVARRCGMNVHAISAFEEGTREPCFSSLKKLALSLEVSVDYLMGIRDQPTGGQVRDSFTKLFNRLLPQERHVIRNLVCTLITIKSTRNPIPSPPFFDSTDNL